MEIKSAIKNSEKMYPTINQINSKELKKNIPNIWFKLGMSTAIFTFLMKRRVFAISASDIIDMQPIVTAGVQRKTLDPTLPTLSIVMIILSAFLGMKNKFKKKKGIKETRIMKVIRISIFVITILLTIRTLIYLNNYYWWI